MKRNHYTAAQRRLLENISGFAFISPWLLGFLAFTAVPIVFPLYYSLELFGNLSFRTTSLGKKQNALHFARLVR
jgi:ABC-type sugar transport system permease subunit